MPPIRQAGGAGVAMTNSSIQTRRRRIAEIDQLTTDLLDQITTMVTEKGTFTIRSELTDIVQNILGDSNERRVNFSPQK